MVPRTLDDRIGYFASTYQWIDDYAGDKPAASGANIVKWDLAKNPVVHFYVDPSVPRALWPAVVEGVTRWNPAFEAAGHARPVLRAVIPTDSDWPSDYAVDDARFNTVSFAPGAMAGAVAGVKSDPRTGEIFNVDVVFYAPMLRSFTTLYRVWYRGDEPDGEESRARVAGRNASSIHTRIAESPPDERVPGSEEDYVYQNVADTTMHEVGHGLGLRHNFRGSAGIPWSQLTNTTFVETHGLSNSVMDYLPAEPLPRAKDDHERRYFTTPVIGAYDFAAIRYGYTAWKSDAEAHAYAASVAASGLAFATDEDQSADALTARFDLSSTPLEWHRHIVRTARARLARLARLARTVGTRPSTSATDFGADVKMLTGNGAGSILAAAKLVGGTVLNRRRTGGVPAAEPVDAATEAAAMAWVLEKIHPATGLLSPATVAAVAPYALAKPAAECGDDAACLGREPAGIVASLASARETILTSLVAASRLAQLDEHAAAAAAAAADGNGGRRRILAPDLLAALTKTFFGDRCAELPPATAAAAAAAPFRADAQVGWVAKLKALSEDANHGAVAAAAAGELSRIAAAVAAAVAATPDSVHLRGLRLSTAAFVV